MVKIPDPTHGKRTKKQTILYAFWKYHRSTPATIREAFGWPEVHRIQDNIECLRSNIRQMTGRGSQYLLYRIEGNMASTYMLNFCGASLLRRKGYISEGQEKQYRRWLTFRVQDELPEGRVRNIMAHKKGGWRW